MNTGTFWNKFLNFPKLKSQFEKALEIEGHPDWEAIDGIMALPEWQNNRHTSRQMRELEHRALGILVGQVSQMLAAEPHIDLPGIAALTDRLIWRAVHHPDKRTAERKLEQFLEDVVREATQKGGHTSALDKLAYFKQGLNQPDFIPKHRATLEKFRQRRIQAETDLKNGVAAVREKMAAHDLAAARAHLDMLRAEFAAFDGLSDLEEDLQARESAYTEALDKLHQRIKEATRDNLDAVRVTLEQLQQRYGDTPELEQAVAALKPCIVRLLGAEAQALAQTSDAAKACRWLEGSLQPYQALVGVTDAMQDRSVYGLYQQYLQQLDDQLRQRLANLDMNGFDQDLDVRAHCHRQVDPNGSDPWMPLQQRVADWRTAVTKRDVKQQLQQLDLMADRLGDMAPESAFCRRQEALKANIQQWERVLAHPLNPEDAAELGSCRKDLEDIRQADGGDLGQRAAQRLKELEKVQTEYQAQEWRRSAAKHESEGKLEAALADIKALMKLMPNDAAAAADEQRLQTRMQSEKERLQEARKALNNGQLHTAQRTLVSLKEKTSVADAAGPLWEALEQQIQSLEGQGEAAWQAAAVQAAVAPNDLDRRLHDVSQDALEPLVQTLEALYQGTAFAGTPADRPAGLPSVLKLQDSERINRYRQLVQTEVMARGRLAQARKLEKEIQDAGHRATVADYGRLQAMLKEALRDIPNYPPLEDMAHRVRDTMQTMLLNGYQQQVTALNLRAARRLLRDDWPRYFPTEDPQPRVQQALGEDFRLDVIEGQIDQAARESIIADNLFQRFNYTESRFYIDRALELCRDDSKAVDLKTRLAHWDTGLELLAQIESLLDRYDSQKAEALLTEAQKTLERVHKLPLSFQHQDLTAYGRRWRTPSLYELEIENRSGIIGKLRLALIPGKTFLLFVTERVSLGNPRDNRADITIRAPGITEEHCRLERNAAGAFFLTPVKGACRIGSQTLTRRQELAAGDSIFLGPSFRLNVASIADSLVLALPNANPVDGSIHGIILLHQRLSIGPGADCQVRGGAAFDLVYESRQFHITPPGRAPSDNQPRLKVGDVHTVEKLQVQIVRAV